MLQINISNVVNQGFKNVSYQPFRNAVTLELRCEVTNTTWLELEQTLRLNEQLISDINRGPASRNTH